jgi:hypothetical protein
MFLKSRFFSVLLFYFFSFSLQTIGKDTIYFRCKEDYTPEAGRIVGSGSKAMTISTVKFYVQHLSVIRKEAIIWTAPSAYLVDLSEVNNQSIDISADIKEGDTLFFLLGIDSTTCVGGVKGNELDPSHAMYWAWQSGYINMKIEGTSPLSNARNNEIQFHVGGYKYPYATAKELRLAVPDKSTHEVVLSLENLLNGIDISTLDHVMSPGENAFMLAEKAAAAFMIF